MNAPSRGPATSAGRVSIASLAMLLAVSAIGCGGDKPAPAKSTSTTATSTAAAPRPQPIDARHPVIRIDTNLGPITLKLDGVNAPGTVRNFLNYATEGFYDNTIVHYVDPGKMIVAGGYTNERRLKPARTAIRNEAHNGLKNVRGTIAMARDPAAVDSATSQFFINLADAPQRDHEGDSADQYGYCVFGEVTEGLEIADKISQSPTTNQSGDLAQTPDPPVVITAIRVVP